MTEPRLLAGLWILLLAATLSGQQTMDLAPAVIGVTSLWLLIRGRGRPDLLGSWLGVLRRWVPAWMCYAGISLVFAACIANYILTFEGLRDALSDTGGHIQMMFYEATRGEPLFTLDGEERTHWRVHRSIGLPALGALYRFFESPWVLLIWQGILLLAPGVIAVFGYRAVVRARGERPEALGDVLAFLTWAALPTVLAQAYWTYAPHLLGISLLSLAYFFYYRELWLPWALALVIVPWDKEEYAFVAIPFGLLVIVESVVSRRGLKLTLALLAAAVVISISSVWAYLGMPAPYPGFASVGGQFKSFGTTPQEVIIGALTNPRLVLAQLSRPEPLKMLAFVAITSGLWLGWRWRSVRYLVPVLPLLGLNLISDFDLRLRLGTHYALPIAVALVATRLYGVMPALRARTRDGRLALFGLLALVPLFWMHASYFRHVKGSWRDYQSRSAERARLAPLRQNRDIVICCEDRNCTAFMDRETVFDAGVCAAGTPALARHAGRDAYYITNPNARYPTGQTQVPRVPYPDDQPGGAAWERHSLFQLSGPWKVQP